MKLLLVSNLFPPEIIGGYELIAYELAERLAAAGHQVAVATSPLVNHGSESIGAGIAVHRVLRYTGLALDKLPAAVREFSSGMMQLSNVSALGGLIDAFSPDQVLLFNIAGLGGLGIVTFLHDAGFSPAIYLGDNVFQDCGRDAAQLDAFLRFFGAHKALQSLHPIAVSQLLMEEVQDTLGMSLAPPLFVPGWIPDELPALPPRSSGGPMRFVFSSRIAPHKGIWVLMDAAKHLLSCGDTGFQIDVYGAGEVPEFVQRIHAEGLASYFRYQGMLGRDAMIENFANYDALLFPTWQREPLGLVPFEAAAQGCIPIMTAQAGAAEWFTAQDCVKIERSPESLAGAMQYLMALSFDDREAWRQRIAFGTRRRFGADRWLGEIERHLAKVPARRHAISTRQAREAMFATSLVWRN